MSTTRYRRPDGAVFLVSADGRVYQVRQVARTPVSLEQDAATGLLVRMDTPDESKQAPPQTPAPKHMRLATSRRPRKRPAAIARGPLALVSGGAS
jgi:hypothetical protein